MAGFKNHGRMKILDWFPIGKDGITHVLNGICVYLIGSLLIKLHYPVKVYMYSKGT